MFNHIETKTVTTRYTFKQLRRSCLNNYTHLDSRKAMEILSALIYKNRFELFGDCQPYQIIVNGYGILKFVNYGNDLFRYTAKQLFTTLYELVGEGEDE